ncbi:transformer-2 homolog beta-like isoform X2 [Paramuricea clavata]|uniref:Transformer-2 homolog beta-like isoform X2 n=1 Tax=Paramuricea clavata TaxID=317549 RepID=A0A7D9I4U7_PARCT|nr:transformer-2 homolog beta-like isoform X2 [Paramuricea clavata]
MAGKIDQHPSPDHIHPELDHTASPDHVQGLVHTVVQSHGLVHHEDLGPVHVLDTRDQKNIPDQDLKVLTTREDLHHFQDAEDIMETGSNCLGIFGLSLYTTERDLKDFLEKYGTVDSCQLVYDHQSGRSRGFAFAYFRDEEEAAKVKEETSGLELDGRRVRVDYSITQRAHTPTPGVYMGKPSQFRNRRDEHGGGGRSRDRYDRDDRRDRYSRSRSRSPRPCICSILFYKHHRRTHKPFNVSYAVCHVYSHSEQHESLDVCYYVRTRLQMVMTKFRASLEDQLMKPIVSRNMDISSSSMLTAEMFSTITMNHNKHAYKTVNLHNTLPHLFSCSFAATCLIRRRAAAAAPLFALGSNVSAPCSSYDVVSSNNKSSNIEYGQQGLSLNVDPLSDARWKGARGLGKLGCSGPNFRFLPRPPGFWSSAPVNDWWWMNSMELVFAEL